jgi:hypothetical protein
MKLFLRIVVPLLCLIATVQALTAIYGDISELKKQAERLACPDGCIQTLEVERTPFHQNFVFQVTMDYPIRKIAVSCQRNLVLFGDYSCAATGPAR